MTKNVQQIELRKGTKIKNLNYDESTFYFFSNKCVSTIKDWLKWNNWHQKHSYYLSGTPETSTDVIFVFTDLKKRRVRKFKSYLLIFVELYFLYSWTIRKPFGNAFSLCIDAFFISHSFLCVTKFSDAPRIEFKRTRSILLLKNRR